MSYLITSLIGSPPLLDFYDLGYKKATPFTDFDMTTVAQEVRLHESKSIKEYITANYIIAKDSLGNTISPGQPIAEDNQTASQVPYDNMSSGLVATDVQAAIDELKTLSGGGGGSDINGEYIFSGSSATYIHNKAKRPSVSVLTPGGDLVQGVDIKIPDANTVQVFLGESVTNYKIIIN